ncbi:glycerophosphodiester phosphodiesterase family protein [Pedobacter sp. BS3]|uniref:glycerophosphodiester phosphodiesterase family protein n=1 Tax=Pedobacter sp. BS3 TaxID=2567937 RepID=UPI0011EEE9CE|nr:glycerophosphodiester phosphodiesterase family protein [Pedobacter sp. BS3]TZF84136.1 glycerophosphodiester phosphodiesterase family protein [Pedobacter sp. BS3]
MRKKIIAIALMLSGGFTGSTYAQKLHTIKVKNLKELQNYFTYSPKKDIIISGHRGGMLPGYPENCIPSCEKTLSLMPSFFEIDPRLTKDSVLVLMHDATLDRTTTGKGNVSDYTYKEIQQFNLKDREGNVTSYKIPTLIEMLDWGKDKTIFNLDNKHVPWEMYSKLLKAHKYPNIMLSVRSIKEALFYYERNDDVILCVKISNMNEYKEFEQSGIPWNRIMAYVGLAMDPKQQAVYDLLHKHGVMCMSSVPSTLDKLPPKQRKAGYLKEIANKPDIIETDYPSLFIGLPLKK